MRTNPESQHASTSLLIALVADLRAAGVRPTPMSIISRATDIGLDDAALSHVLDQLAQHHDIEAIAA
jgi:hypothetical protein